MTADTVLTMLQIVIPFALFGALMVGGASPSVARWLGRPRRPFRFARRPDALARPAAGVRVVVPVEVSSGRLAGRGDAARRALLDATCVK